MTDTKTIRIFISSPSDVRPERLKAEQIITRLDSEFAYHFRVEAVLWEREPLVATHHFQDERNILRPSNTDIVVVILWSRLGVPLPEDRFRGAISKRPVTGTEWEFEDAFASARERGVPDLLLYRKQSAPTAELHDRQALNERLAQLDLVEDFVGRWFRSQESGGFTAASHSFETVTEFEEKLYDHLRELLERRAGARTEGVEIRWHHPPFRGLLAFEYEHSAVFFGRTRARNELRELLARQDARGRAFLLVLGASGSGKSSLVKAGVLPDLELPGMIGRVALVRHAMLRPSDRPDTLLGGLSAAILADGALPELHGLRYTPERLADLLASAPEQAAFPIEQGLAEASKTMRLAEIAEARLVVIVDQLEELFTIDRLDSAERSAFIEALDALARSGLVWIVATMRSDFYDRLELVPLLARLAVPEACYRLLPPDDAELGQIIRQPAREAGLSFELDPRRGVSLDEVIRQAAAQDRAALPLLSFLLDQLWQRRTAHGELTFAAYEELGYLEGALSRRAEEVFEALPPPVREALPQVLRALVTVGQGSHPVIAARRAPLLSFPTDSAARQLITKLLEPQARLLVADGEGSGATIRITHEALLEHWPRAARQIAEDMADLRLRARLEDEAARWSAATAQDRDSLLLAPGLPLSEAEDLLTRREGELDAAIASYIRESTEIARRRQRRQTRRLQAAAAVLFVLTLTATVGAWFGFAGQHRATEQAQIAESRRAEAELRRQQADAARGEAVAEKALAEQAQRRSLIADADRVAAVAQQLEDQGRGDLAGALALQVAPRHAQGVERPLTPAIGAAIARLVRRDHELLRRDLSDNILRVAVSKDSKTIVTGLNTGRIQFWSLPEMMLRKDAAAQHDVVTSLEISPDQSSVLVAGDKVPSVWDLATGEKRFDLPVPNPVKFIKMALWSPDGSMIATAGGDNRVLIFAGGDGHLLREIKGPEFAPLYERAQRRAEAAGGSFMVGDPIIGAVAQANFQIWGTTTDIAFSPDGKTIAVAGPADPEAGVRLYDVGTGKLRATDVGPQTSLMGSVMGYGDSLVFDREGTRIATIAGGNNIQIYDTISGELKQSFTTSETESILFTGDGEGLVSAHGDGSITFWCVATGRLVTTLRAHNAGVDYLRFNDDQTMFTSSSHNGTAAIWPMPSTKLLCSDNKGDIASVKAIRPLARLEGHTYPVHRTLFLEADEKLVTVSQDGSVRLWRLAERGVEKIGSSPPGSRPDSTQVYFSASGRQLVVLDSWEEKVAAWSVDDRRLIADLEAKRIVPRLPGGKVGISKTPFATVPLDQVATRDGVQSESSALDLDTPSDLDWSISPDGARAIGSPDWLDYFKRMQVLRDNPKQHESPLSSEPGTGELPPPIAAELSMGSLSLCRI